MKFATVRDFRVNASKVLDGLNKEEVLVTKRGRPVALLVSVTEKDLDEVRSAFLRVKFQAALRGLWADARRKGKDKITMEEIDAQIAEARKEKRAKRSA
jgi:prevent-host-death family protein